MKNDDVEKKYVRVYDDLSEWKLSSEIGAEKWSGGGAVWYQKNKKISQKTNREH